MTRRPPLSVRVSARTARISTVVCVLLGAGLWLGPALLRDDLFADDAAQHIFWLYRYADPGLFPDDPSVEYLSSGSNAPIGYRALFATLAPLIDSLVAAEWLTVLILMATALFAALLGREAVRGSAYAEIGGLAGAAITMALLSRIDVLQPAAFQRSFAMPLTLACLWALVSQRYRWVGVSWILSALLYPVILPVLGLSGGVIFLLELVRDRRMPPKWIWNGVLGGTAIAIVLVALGTPDGTGPMVTYEQAMSLPEFGPRGRQALWGVGWHENVFWHYRTGIGVPARILAAACVAAAAAVALGRRRWIPPAALVMGATGLALWAAARATLFTLYLPNRHSRWSVTAAAVAMLTAGTVAIVAACVEWLERRSGHERGTATNAGRSGPLLTLAMVMAPLIVAAALYPEFVIRWNSPREHDLERAYAYLETLPKDTLVAAHPDVANNVPLRARRSVLASTETALAFHRGYYSKQVPRIEASLDAAYATDWAALDARLRPYGVDVVLSRDAVFRNPGYYPPFDTRVAQLTHGVDPSAFVLRNPPADRLLFRSGDVVVVRVGS